MQNHGSDEAQHLFSGEWLDVRRRQGREFALRKRCTGIAIIIAVNNARELLLTEQYRAPVDRNVLELPAGMVGDEPGEENETVQDAAIRELLEETGYQAVSIEEIISGPISSGLTAEIMTFFYTDNVLRQHAGGGNNGEKITVHRVALGHVEKYLEQAEKSGLLIDPKIYIGLYFVRKYMQQHGEPDQLEAYMEEPDNY